uniref:Cyclic nucleotide-binding domain-containing protein n=1 Tax=Arcella intermedia TaxID=1963864 RepID=A0A6B2KX66_9EUKA
MVHYLTLPENSPIRAFWNYDRFLYHFLIIFPSFLSPLELLSELIQRWDALPGPQEDVDGHGMSVRYSIAGVLREWLQMPWSNDFKEEPLRETLEAFLEANTKGEFNRVIEQLQLLHSTAGEGKSTFGAPPPPVALEKKPSSIYETSPLETARQLTLIASELYSRLDRDQFLKGAWYGEMKAERAGGLLGIIEHSNEVTCWVTTEILKFCSAESRAEMISFWIQTLSHLLQLNNYNTMIQILSSLHSSVISKLKHSWKLISKKDKDLLDTITQLMSTQSHYKAYREAITNLNENTPCIPLIHVICSDLFTIHDTLTDCSVVENEWVNWRKFDVMASRISELVRFNRVNYNLEVEMRVKGMVLNSERWLNHDVNYEIACVLEDTVNLEEELEVQNYTNTWDLYQMPFLSERDKKLIVTGAKSIAFQADQVILGENEKNCYLYLIEKGKVKVKSSGVIISRLKDGDFFGEISLFSKKPTTASVISETNCQIYQIEVDLVEDLCIHKPNVAVQLIRTLINKLITYTKEICEIEFIPHTQSQPSFRMSEESPHLNLSLPTLNNFPLNSIDTSSETTDTQEQSLNFGKRLKSARRSRKLTFATNEKYYEHKAKRHSLKAKSSEFVLLNQIEAQNPLDSSDNSSNTKKSKFPDLSVSQQTRKRSSSHSIRNHLKKSKSESSQKIVKVNKKKKSGNLTPRLAFSKEEPEGGSLQESNEPTESLSKKSKRESEYKFGKLIVSSRVKGKDSEPILPPNQDTGIDEKISKHFHGEKELLDEVVVREFSCSLLKHPSKVKSTGQLLITQHFVLFVGSAGKVGFGKIRFYYSFKDIAAITFNPTPQTLAVTISKPDEATVVFGSFCSTPAEVYRFVAELWKRHTDGAVDLDEQAPISPGTDWDLKAEMDWKKIFKGGKVCKFEKNECIVREGDMTHKIYHLVQGKCRVEKGNGEIVQYIYPGKMGLFGEMSFIEGKPSPFSVIAEEKSLVHLCEGYYLNILFQRYPAIASRFYNYLAVVLAKRRVLDLKGEPLVLHSERPLMRRKAQSRLLMKKKQGAWLYYLEHSGVTDVVLSDTESEEWVEEENAAEESESLEENVQLQ